MVSRDAPSASHHIWLGSSSGSLLHQSRSRIQFSVLGKHDHVQFSSLIFQAPQAFYSCIRAKSGSFRTGGGGAESSGPRVKGTLLGPRLARSRSLLVARASRLELMLFSSAAFLYSDPAIGVKPADLDRSHIGGSSIV